ncbi:hypothetical protein ACP70R_019888 [Stipagrostis hirtigluma subsp. patula]
MPWMVGMDATRFLYSQELLLPHQLPTILFSRSARAQSSLRYSSCVGAAGVGAGAPGVKETSPRWMHQISETIVVVVFVQHDSGGSGIRSSACSGSDDGGMDKIIVVEERKIIMARAVADDGGGDAAGEHGAGAGLHHGLPHPLQARAKRRHGALRPPRLQQHHRRRHHRSLRLLLQEMILLAIGLYYYGLRATSAAYSVNFLNLVPVVTFVLAVALRAERLAHGMGTWSGRMKMACTAISVGGAMVVSLYKGKLLHLGV